MRYEAVIFDMDGTVLDTLEDLHTAINHSLSHFGLPQVSSQHVRASLGNGAKMLVRRCLPQNSSPELERELLEYYSSYYNSHCRIKTRPYEGIVELMNRLRARGIKLAILSNKPDPAVKELAAAFFPGLLDSAVGESETVLRKPDPTGVLQAVSQLGLEKERCVYVGDSQVDIATAQNASMPCIAVCWGFRSRQELEEAGAKELAENATELEKLICPTD